MRTYLRYARHSYREPRTGEGNVFREGRLFRRRPHLSDVDRACIGRRKKNRISARRAFHQFPSALTNHNRTSTDNPNIGDSAGGAILIYAIRRRTYYQGASAKFSIRRESRFAAMRPMRPLDRSCRSRILLGEVSTVTSIRH